MAGGAPSLPFGLRGTPVVLADEVVRARVNYALKQHRDAYERAEQRTAVRLIQENYAEVQKQQQASLSDSKRLQCAIAGPTRPPGLLLVSEPVFQLGV
jgi:hypothetical protein